MLIVLKSVLIISGAFYVTLMLAYAIGFQLEIRRHRRRGDTTAGEPPRVSVVVPARDEETTIATCIDSILANDYPADRLEVVVVDDGSTDGTAEQVARFEGRNIALMLVPTGERGGKKNAIETGIGHASGEIILTVDADCVVPGTWVGGMVRTFGRDTSMVTGPVVLSPVRGFVGRLVALESLGLVGVGAGGIGIRVPSTCNGANLAYRKETFRRVGGFSGIDHVLSGDDDMLMHKMAARRADSIRFCAEPGCVVETAPPDDRQSFWSQRVRWASKGLRYRDLRMVLVMGLVYVFYASLLAATLTVPFVERLWPIVLWIFVAKIVAEIALLAPVSYRFGRARLLSTFLPGQILQIPYVVLVGLAGAFGTYSWKGRASHST